MGTETQPKELSFKWKGFNKKAIKLTPIAHAPHVSTSDPVIVFDSKIGICEAFLQSVNKGEPVISRTLDGLRLGDVTHIIELKEPAKPEVKKEPLKTESEA